MNRENPNTMKGVSIMAHTKILLVSVLALGVGLQAARADEPSLYIQQVGDPLTHHVSIVQNGTRTQAGPLADLQDPWGLGDILLISPLSGAQGSLATVIQSGADDLAQITQMGISNVAMITQSGSGDVALISQIGTENQATILQTGSADFASITQQGAANLATITQTGSGNTAVIAQR